MGADFWIVIKWWGTLFLLGTVSFPLTKKMFAAWYDNGYLFAKAVGMAFVTYIVYVAARFHVAPFSFESICIAMIVLFFLGILLHMRNKERSEGPVTLQKLLIIAFEEVFFFVALLGWSWVKGHEPSIHGLEKFMDFGFMQSILNSSYFPAPDMWYAGYPINYYYFGHTVVAVLTKLSAISLDNTFNLMLSTIFALCVTMSFSIGVQLCRLSRFRVVWQLFNGFLTAFLVSLAGNMQTLYAFTKGYTGENVQPFWQLLWTANEFISKLPEGLERYWYANATRFIPFTIHEFPSYSFVVSDIHGHVLSIPFVLLALAFLISLFTQVQKIDRVAHYIFYGVLVSILLMTNALDGPIYMGLFIVLFGVLNWKKLTVLSEWIPLLIVIIAAVLGSIPFMSHFSSFVTGLAVNCPLSAVANTKFGPLLFEGMEKCQHSPFWMMWLLWGFFIYCGVWYITKIFNIQFSLFNRAKKFSINTKVASLDLVLLVFFCVSIALIIFPEFFYFKDIYPAHFRSNTMFKLGYQAFIMFSILAGYTTIIALSTLRAKVTKVFLILLIPQLFLVSIYPIFSVRSYFDSLRTYKGINGITWLKESYPDDFAAVQWLRSEYSTNRHIDTEIPVIIEADGDSYTDHARISAFTGFPAVIGWPVHEWLWRGTYDVVAPRREEVRVIYESDDDEASKAIIQKYGVDYIMLGGMERTKFTQLNIEKLDRLADVVFQQGEFQIYKVKE